jgi:hypothetical protein
LARLELKPHSQALRVIVAAILPPAPTNAVVIDILHRSPDVERRRIIFMSGQKRGVFGRTQDQERRKALLGGGGIGQLFG